MQTREAILLDGNATAKAVKEEIARKIEALKSPGKRSPGLSVILVGDDPASHIYVKNKVQSCKAVGIESNLYQFPAGVAADEMLSTIARLNADESVDGILVQLPLPAQLPSDVILHAVSPEKDVDGLHPLNLGRLLEGRPGLRPCTPLGIMVLLERYGIQTAGRSAVVIGRSNLVGKPAALMLLERHATVTICHSKSKNLEEIAQSADILVVAAGRDGLVRGSFIKPGAVVVDVGIHRRPVSGGKSRIVGDVAFDEAVSKAGHITPVPGGVGPMTVAMLLSNTLSAYNQKHND